MERWFRVSREFFGLLPNAAFGVVVASGLDNSGANERIRSMLDSAVRNARERFAGDSVKALPAVQIYRKAFEILGFNANKFPSSIEALLSRIAKGGSPPYINPAVDLVNSVSIAYSIPMGCHDMDTFKGDMEVRLSHEDDRFLPFGSVEWEAMPAGEPVYVSGNEVRTRKWIWRQSDIGKTTDLTRSLFIPIDGFSGEHGNARLILEARNELAEAFRRVFGAEVRMGFVDSNSMEFRLS